MQGSKEKDKSLLKDLLQQENIGQRVKVPPSSRHSRFGTVFQQQTKEGAVHIYTSVQQTEQVSKGGRLWLREFRDPTAPTQRNSRTPATHPRVFHRPVA